MLGQAPSGPDDDAKEITAGDAVTVTRTATGWLTAHDPERLALRRAARVTLAACIGFFVCRYAFDAPVMSTYAVFGAISTGMLSEVSGPPALRTRAFALPVGLALVAIGTAAARSTPAAVVGMLVVGFLVAYSGSAAHASRASPMACSCSTSCPASRPTTPARCRSGSSA